MKKQTKKTSNPPRLRASAVKKSLPRLIVPGNYPVKPEHRTHLKHPTPPWWPRTAAAQIALGYRVLEAIESIQAELAYTIPNNLVANLRFILELYEKVKHWRINIKALGIEYTDFDEFIRVGAGFVNEPNQIIILKLDANAVANLGPVTADIEIYSGLLGILIAIEESLKKCPAYLANKNFGDRLGFITTPAAKPDLTAVIFEFKGFKLVKGKPAVKWKTLGRHKVDGAAVEYREVGDPEAEWKSAGTIIKNPGVLDIQRHTNSRDVELQGRYIKNNEQQGDWSPTFRVTIPAEQKHHS
jgi:hypothetical protein